MRKPENELPGRPGLAIRVALILGLLTHALHAYAVDPVWTEISPTLMVVWDVRVNPTTPATVYAATEYGVMVSTDSAQTWSHRWKMAGSLMNGQPLSLAVDPTQPSTLYAGCAPNYLYKSTDNGVTWTNIVPLAAINSGRGITAIAIDPTSASTIYAGGNDGIYKTTDGGANFYYKITGLPYSANYPVMALAIHPTTPNVVYAGTQAGLYLTTDGGDNWGHPATAPTGKIFALVVNPASPSTVFAGGDDGVFKSIDSGATWSPVNTGLGTARIFSFAVSSAAPSTILAGSGRDGVFRSTDSGATWNAIGSSLTTSYFGSLAINNITPTTFYTGARDGVYKTTDGGTTWAFQGFGNAPDFGLDYFTDVATTAVGGNSIVIAASGSRGIQKSTDGGVTWRAISAGLPEGTTPRTPFSPDLAGVSAVTVDPTNPSVLYAGISAVYKSMNGGDTWVDMSDGWTSSSVIDLRVDPHDNTTVYAVTPSGLRKNTNGGPWTTVYGYASSLSGHGLAFDSTTPGVVYTSDSGYFFKSIDGGLNWTWSPSGMYQLSSIVPDDADPNLIYGGASNISYHFGKSTDGGLTWTLPPDDTLFACYALKRDPTGVLDAVNGDGFFQSADGGTSWTPHRSGMLSHMNVYNLDFDGITPGRTYVASGTGLWALQAPTALAPTNLVATATTSNSINVTWTAGTGAVSYELVRLDQGYLWSTIRTATNSHTDSVNSGTSYVYAVRAINASGAVSAFSNIDVGTTSFFTDDPLVAGTFVKATHFLELRTAINAVRHAAGSGRMSSFSFTDYSLAGQPVKALHLQEMITALQQARTALNLSTMTFPTPVAGVTPVAAIDLTTLRTGVK